MSIPFEGFVLRKPRIAPSNNPFTAEGDVFVRDQDRSTYITEYVDNDNAVTTEYLVQVYETSDLVVPTEITETAVKVSDWVYQFNAEGRSIEQVVSVNPMPFEVDLKSGLIRYNSDPGQDVVVTWEPARLKINWTKNDDRTRFGFDDRVQRWTPLPGSGPDNLGELPDTSEGATPLSLPVYEEIEPLLVVSTPDVLTGTVVPVPPANRLSDGQFQPYLNGTSTVPTGEAVLNVESGALLFADDLISNFLNQPVYYFRENFFDYDDSTGQIGVVGDNLYMNPVPSTTEVPRIRIKYRTYLRGEQSTTATTPSVGYDYVWNPNNGRIYLDATVESTFEGDAIYYDGVFSNTEPVPSYDHTNLGAIEAASPFNTAGLSDIDFTQYDTDSIILYITETGEAIPNLDYVSGTSDFTNSLNLPETKAEIVGEGPDLGQIQLSYSLRKEAAANGYTLSVGTVNFPIEKGISFKFDQSPIDQSNNRGIPDGRGVIRVADQVIADGVPAGPSFLLNQVPLQDVDGYDVNTFYRIQNGAQQRILEPDVDVIYDFDNRQLLWAEPASHSTIIPTTSYSVQLPNQVLHNKEYLFELNEGGGFQTLDLDDDIILNFDTGTITFIETVGDVLYEDVGVLTAPDTLEATTADFTGLSIPSDPLLAPLLLIEEDAYRIVSSTSSTITTERDIDLGGTSTEFVIIEAPEIVYRYALEAGDLNERTVFPYVVTDVGTYAPDAEALEFTSDGAVVSHVTLDEEVLGTLGTTIGLPVYYQAPEANYRIFREDVELVFTSGSPAPGEYGVSGTDLVFNSADETNFVGERIILDPELSSTRTTGPIEVLADTRELGVPTDLAGTDLDVRALVPEDAYTLQDKVIFFDKPFRSNERLFVRYTDTEGNVLEENVGFRVQEDLGNVGSGVTNSFATGRTIDDQRPTQVLVNGARSDLGVNTNTKQVEISNVRQGRRVAVSYYALDANGGENVVSLLNSPSDPPVEFEAGTTQTFNGDHTDVLDTDVFLQADAQSFTVVSVTYDGGTNVTTVEVTPAVPEFLRNPNVLVSTTPITEKISLSVDVDANSAGEQEVRLLGDVTDDVKQSKIIYLDGDPYYIQAAGYEQDTGFTRVTTAAGLMREYSSPAVQLSEYPVYAPDSQVLLTERFGIPEETLRLVRFDENEVGSIVDPEQGYTFEAGGRIILEPTITPAPAPDEVWYFAYTGLRGVGPKIIAGQQFLPRFKASYTRRVNASEENGILGATLRASFDFNSPDTFYFRAVRMSEYAFEVSEDIDENARNQAASGGPVIATTQSTDLFEQGREGLIWEGGDLRDQDRAGRVFLEYYNEVINKFESILEVVDGRVIGDRDGKFLFRLRADDTPGGIDPVTGELLPYYANPKDPGDKPTSTEIQNTDDLFSQLGVVQNSIDDIVMVTKKPWRLELGLPPSIEFQGTFKAVWEASKYSRLYPEQKDTFSVTLPQVNGQSEYKFPADFLKILADPKEESLLSIQNIRKRSAKAWITQDGTSGGGTGAVRVDVAMEFDRETGNFNNTTYDPTTSVPPEYIPAFEVGDHVNLGRVTYSESGGVITQDVDVYAENMVVAAVGANFIELDTNPEIGNSDFDDLTITDVTTIDPERGDTIFTVPKVADSSFSIADSTPPYYRPPLDLAINASEGELINTTLPKFIGNIIGQADIAPLTFLDMTVNFRNRDTEPFRFPALDGELVDDDGDHPPPYVEPFLDSELQRKNQELLANQSVETNTDEGTVIPGTVADSTTITVSTDLTSLTNPPDTYDLVVIENQVDGGGASIEYDVATITPTEVNLAAFVYEDTALSFTVDDLYRSTGERDTLNTSQWNDGTTDFTRFSGYVTLTLNVDDGSGGYSQYDVTSVSNGFVQVATPISESGPADYYLTLEDAGSIPARLDRIEATSMDFSDAQGTLTVSSSGPNNGTYTIEDGGVGFVTVELDDLPLPSGTSVIIGLSNSSVVANGTSSVDSSLDQMQTVDSVAGVEPGQTLIIDSDTVNAGRFTVESVTAGSPNVITIEETFYTTLGDSSVPNYPMTWRVTKPRRFSPEMDALSSELVRQRVTYALNSDSLPPITSLLTATSDNPSTPLKERLLELRDLLFGNAILSVTGGDIIASSTAFEGDDFVAAGIEQGDFVVVETGPNQGFYTVTTVDDTVSPQQLIVSETNEYTTYTLADEAGVDFEVFRGEVLGEEANQLVLYEYFNVIDIIERIDAGIIMSIHDPTDLRGAVGTLAERPGDPFDSTLQAHRTEIEDRLDWIRDDSPNLRQEIVAVLKGTEVLYDIRYAWIDFRTNREDGTLPRRRRFFDDLSKRRRKRRRELIKLLSSS